MTDEKFVLYVDSQFLSPYAMSAYVTLIEKGVSFDIKKVDLAAKDYYESDFARLSLTYRVPTLVHGSFHLSESSAISEYLDELLPAPDYPRVYPSDIQSKAMARQIQAWLRSDFMPIREERSTEVVFVKPTDKPLSKSARESAARLFTAADSLLQGEAINLFGEWCIADTDLALMLNRLVLNGDEVPENLASYAKCQWLRPSVQQWMKQKISA